MLNDFLISLKVKNAYTVNQIIYSLQRFPLLGKLIPNSLYKMKCFKIISIIISIIIQIVKIFGFKLLYILVFLIYPLSIYQSYSQELIIHIYLFLALIGCFSNTEIFNPTKDKYYMIVLMKMNAKNHTLSNFIYFLSSIFIGHITAMFLLVNNIVSWYNIILLATLTILLKFIAINFYFYRMKKSNKVINENKPSSWSVYFGLMIGGLALAYGLPYFNIVISLPVFYVFALIVIVLGLLSIKSIFSYDKYAWLYKKLLNKDTVFAPQQDNTQVIASNIQKQISVDKNITSDKSGFAFFHDLFVKRHRKILIDSAKKTTVVILIVVLVVAILTLINPQIKTSVNSFTLLFLPYMLFLMYFINTGKNITNAMFMNCDHSMLSYRFFRQSKTVLALFKERLKTIIFINLLPTLTLAISLCFLLFITGGTNNYLNYLVIFFSILSMSIFFSVHNLIIYYLLQPYNVGMEMKSSTYTVINIITYWACYYISQMKVTTLVFGSLMILFAVIYSFISLFLVYKYAPKTFKLR